MDEIIRKLEKLDSESTQDGVCHSYVSISKNDTEVVLKGNAEGLVWIALQALRLANQNPGAHIHIDEVGMADSAEIDLVIANTVAK